MNPKWKTPKGRKRAANRKAYLKRKATAGAKVPAKVKAYVKKAIDREIEDKYETLEVFSVQGTNTTGRVLGYGINNQTSYTGITSSNSIIPVLNSGSSIDNRLGNKVSVKQFYVRYHISAEPQNTTTNIGGGLPFYACVLFYSRKDSKTNNTNDTIMEYGNSNTSLTNIEGLTLKFNKDLYNIHGFYKHKLYQSQAKDAAGVSTAVSGISGFQPSASNVVKIKLPSKLIYDDAAAQPTNSRIYASVGVFNYDNSKYLPSSTYRATIQMTSHLVYQDA